MIGRSHRFHGLNSLRHVYARGQTVRGPLLAIKYIFNNKRSDFRVAVVVSRKVHKSAVVRNRIRRRIYELVRTHASELVQPFDIVITIFSDTVATMPAQELETTVMGQLQRAGVVGAASPSERSQQRAEHAIVEQIAPREQKETT